MTARDALTSFSRRRRAEIRSRARRRSISIWRSPGPLVAAPPPAAPMPPASESRWVHSPRRRARLYCELGQLDLELALGGRGVVGEDVEDDRRAVDDRHAELLLERALLPRRELVVGGDEVRVGRLRAAP